MLFFLMIDNRLINQRVYSGYGIQHWLCIMKSRHIGSVNRLIERLPKWKEYLIYFYYSSATLYYLLVNRNEYATTIPSSIYFMLRSSNQVFQPYHSFHIEEDILAIIGYVIELADKIIEFLAHEYILMHLFSS